MLDARTTRHRDVDLDIAPSSFSSDTTDRRELSRYVLEDLLRCTVDCRIIVCIRSGAQGDPTEASYSKQARSIASSRNDSGISTEMWSMSGEMYYVLQGTISRSSFSDEVMSGNLSESHFVHYYDTRHGDFGISFNGTNQVLSVPWDDVIHYSKTVMFFGKCFDQLRTWGPVFRFKTDPEYAHHVFRCFALEYFGDARTSAQLFAAYKEYMSNIYIQSRMDQNRQVKGEGGTRAQA
ncbi:hypothetical protein ACHAW5_004671 [Stephanodiscus triporus]|uniref:Uncharacterized protein n=1 Tax=Stephanodiscus triporus TaxID=2934178 RepID=A0ABD3N8M3_9STRA